MSKMVPLEDVLHILERRWNRGESEYDTIEAIRTLAVETEKPQPIRVGDRVRVKAEGIEGRIVRRALNGPLVVKSDYSTYHLCQDDLERIHGNEGWRECPTCQGRAVIAKDIAIEPGAVVRTPEGRIAMVTEEYGDGKVNIDGPRVNSIINKRDLTAICPAPKKGV